MASESVTAYIYKLGTRPPSEEEAGAVVRYSFSRLRTSQPQMFTAISAVGENGQIGYDLLRGTILGDHNDNTEQLTDEVRKRHPQCTVYNVGLCTEKGDTYRVVFVLPNVSETGDRKVELYDDVLASIRDKTDPVDLSGEFSERLEIRQLLGSWGCFRKGLILAGSPGWDSPQSTPMKSKNSGTLVATWNDCNDIIQALLAGSPDGTLYGRACLGTIQTREGFFGLMKYMTIDLYQRRREHDEMQKKAINTGFDSFKYVEEHDEFHALAIRNKIKGYLGTDSFLWGFHFDGDGLVEVLPGGGAAIFQPWEKRMCRIVPLEFERLICQKPMGEIDPYILVFYSGHGSSDGNMQIERTEAIHPEELVDVSKDMQVPLFVVLDMCHSARFGERFVRRLDTIGWKGMVLTANDAGTSSGLSFEAESMAAVRKPSWPISFNRPDWTQGRGVFTSAFLLSLLYLYESEQSSGKPHTVNVRTFTEEILRVVARQISKNYGVPVLRPCLFSH